ncbi:hypothetical protein [Streptomyces prunicolor]|uniref:hypothetical protein n=1 Tax=Streptomyces prunicolor TaxID=67348 RepID=UPI0003A60684|nr:hypothetical protein [Streptomyces prunicolor]
MIATYAFGFGHDPMHAPGVAHLYEHLYLVTLRAIMTAPMVAQAQTHADTMSVSATVLAEADHELVTAMTTAHRMLAEGRIDDDVRLRECRAIDVELAEWFGNPLLVAGYKLAALATRRPQLARFDECGIGTSSAIAKQDLQTHAALQCVAFPERMVIVGPRPPEDWLLLAKAMRPSNSAVSRATSHPECGSIGSGEGVPGADSRVYISIPLRLSTPENAEAVQLAAQVLLHGRGPLAAVGDRVGVRFRGGSVVPTAGCAVVTGSWLMENHRQREAIGAAVSQRMGKNSPTLIAAQVATVPERRRAVATTSATLAAAIDDWQSGYGISPTAAGTPGVDEIDQIMWAGWERSVLVGAKTARSEPF